MIEKLDLKITRKNNIEYPIIIGNDILNDFFEYLSKYSECKKILVVTNKKIKDLYGKFFRNEDTDFVVLEDGEIYKNIKSYEKIIDKACEINLERKDAIVALGGGVIGDLAGFAAATYLRGVDFIQVPTTLLAMVDSSVGGKTGYNNSFGKNLIGAFYQPKFVFADINTLKTLDKKQFESGLGEVLKYGFLEKNCELPQEMNFATFLYENSDKILNFDEETLIKVIKSCCILKSSIVEKDEKESGLRRILNLGHTIGHAIENVMGYQNITHGQAIIIGTKIMFNYAVRTMKIDEIYRNNAFKLIDKFIPDEKGLKVSPEKIEKAMIHDKKMVDGKIKFVVPSSRREVVITDNMNIDILKDEIKKYFTN